jgi:hypothetical protein
LGLQGDAVDSGKQFVEHGLVAGGVRVLAQHLCERVGSQQRSDCEICRQR